MSSPPVTRVWQDKNHIYIQSGYHLKEHCKAIPGARWLKDKLAWQYHASPATAGAIMDMFGSTNILYDPKFIDLALRWKKLTERKHQFTEKWPTAVVFQPWDHQLNAYQYIQSVFGPKDGAVGLFAGMGTGKTLVATAVIVAKSFKRTLIVSPSNMVEKWADEFAKYAPRSGFSVVPLTGPLAKRAAIVKDMPRRDPGNFVFVTNYEGVWQNTLGTQIAKEQFDCIILDEAQAIKTTSSKVSQFLFTLGMKTPYRMALTGTPAHDKITDVFGIYRFLDPGVFGTNKENFFQEYTHRRHMGKYSIVTGYKNEDQLSERMYRMAYRVPESVLNLPEGFPPITRPVYLTDDGDEAYQEFERNLVLRLKEGNVAAGNILTKLLRLQQITSGYLPVIDPLDDDRVIDMVRVDDSKYKELISVLDEIDTNEPVVVFARFTKDLEQIRDAAAQAGRGYFEESGSAHEWRTWQEDCTGGEVLGVQVDTGSSGISLYRSAFAVYFSTGYSLGNYEQSKARLRRPGQTQRVRYIHLAARHTVDEDVMAALISKKNLADYVVDVLRTQRGD